MATQRYESGDGSFWEYEVKGASYTTRSGKARGKGSTETFDFESAGATWGAVARAVRQIEAQGYQLIGADGKRVAPTPTEPSPSGPAAYIRTYFLRSFPKPTAMFEVELDGASIIERTWTISAGSKVDEKRREFRTVAAALQAADAAIEAKLAQGYEHDRTQGESPIEKRKPKKQRASIDPRAEAALLESPDDPKVWQVYADAMLQAGEAWGEVIVAACGRKQPKARQAAAAKEILGRAAKLDGCSITWQHGTVEELALVPEEENTDILPALERALEHPAGRLMRSLVLGLTADDVMDWSFDRQLALLADGPVLPLLHTLDLSRENGFMDQASWRRIGDLRPLWKIAPRLRELRLFGGPGVDGDAVKLGPIVAPHLETLVYKSGGLDRSVARDLGKAALPRLAHLELWFGREEYGNTHSLKDLAGILGGAKLPALVRLGLRNSEWRAELIETIAKSAILPRLNALDLADGTLGDESAEALLAHAERFAHFETLSLDNNFLAKRRKKQLEKAIPGVVFGTQREDHDGYRYTEVGE